MFAAKKFSNLKIFIHHSCAAPSPQVLCSLNMKKKRSDDLSSDTADKTK